MRWEVERQNVSEEGERGDKGESENKINPTERGRNQDSRKR